MSLGISLVSPEKVQKECRHCGSLYSEYEEIYTSNITHNLGDMAEAAGLYDVLWRPYRLMPGYTLGDDHIAEYEFEIGVKITASALIDKLESGLVLLKSKPEHFKKFNPNNGWGNYDGLVNFVESYLIACKETPDAIVRVDR